MEFKMATKKEYPQEIYDQITEALDLPKNSQRVHWDIEDSDLENHIYLIHYVDEKIKEIINTDSYKSVYDNVESQTLLNLTGVIISLADPENPWIACRSHGHSSEIHVSKIDGQVIKGKDNNNNQIELSTENAVYQPYYHGPVLRIWKYKGKTYCSTRRRIHTNKSRWGERKVFEKLFIEHFGNNCTSLEDVGNIMFDPSKHTSNVCYAFILCVPKVSVGFRANIGSGFLVFLRSYDLNIFYNNDAFQRYAGWENIETTYTWMSKKSLVIPGPSGPNFVPVPEITVETENKFIVGVPSFNQFIANKILLTGYTSMSEKDCEKIDERLRPGESIIMLTTDGRISKLVPTCGFWRNAVMHNNPNIYNQYFHLLEHAQKENIEKYMKTYLNPKQFVPSFNPDEKYSYQELFPFLGNPSSAEIQNQANKIYVNSELTPPTFPAKTSEITQELLIRNMSLCFLYAVPWYNIQTAGGYYTSYLDDLDEVRKFMNSNLKYLGSLIEENKLQEDPRFGNEQKIKLSGLTLKFVIESSLEHINTRIKNNQIYKIDKETKMKREMSTKEILKENIHNFLKGLKGASLYSLVKAANSSYEDEEK